jgi:hypothetical protein
MKKYEVKLYVRTIQKLSKLLQICDMLNVEYDKAEINRIEVEG